VRSWALAYCGGGRQQFVFVIAGWLHNSQTAQDGPYSATVQAPLTPSAAQGSAAGLV
jgi:hypothetical protein